GFKRAQETTVASPSSHHFTSLHQTKSSNHKEDTKNNNTVQTVSRTKQTNQEQQKKMQQGADYITAFKLGKDISRASTSTSSTKRLREDRRTQLSTSRHDNDEKLTPERDGSLAMQEPVFLPPIK
ncbi:Hypothetical predicted protein, partial [Paramuricea clavata]